MAFSFNWAGLNIPRIDSQPRSTAGEIAANLGKAQWGSEVRDANEEYADMLASGSSVAEEARRIEAEIARLEARNSEIRAGQENARRARLAEEERIRQAEDARFDRLYNAQQDSLAGLEQYGQGAAGMLAALNAQHYRTR